MFFRDLRALRAQRGLGLTEIAERTRFPADTLASVESGPGLPSLPALEAYLRGCGEPLAAWEDRWRQLHFGATAAVASGEDLPVREAGTSQLAAAGTALAGATATTGPEISRPAVAGADSWGSGQAGSGQAAAYTIKRLGSSRERPPTAPRRRIPSLRYAAATGAAALLATGGVALLAWNHAAGGHAVGQHSRTVTAPRPTGTRSMGGGNRPAVRPTHGTRPQRPSAALVEVTGIGCPRDSVLLASAPAGPGWTASDGGWTGNGCDGSTVWTMDPNGNQPVSSVLTWKFGLSAGVSHCTVAVFVPTRNALGVGEYAVFAGDTATGSDIASVAVSQAAAAGQWVTLGSYPVRGTSLEVQVAPAAGTPGDPGPGAYGRDHDTGQGPGHNAAIAASAARAACG